MQATYFDLAPRMLFSFRPHGKMYKKIDDSRYRSTGIYNHQHAITNPNISIYIRDVRRAEGQGNQPQFASPQAELPTIA